jgi:hypothetical protein
MQIYYFNNISDFSKTFGGQNYNPYLNAIVFSTQEKIRHLWQPKMSFSYVGVNMHQDFFKTNTFC